VQLAGIARLVVPVAAAYLHEAGLPLRGLVSSGVSWFTSIPVRTELDVLEAVACR
jgi:hypothetical protein